MKEAKKLYLEIIRIIAIVCVIYNHTGERGNNIWLFTNGKITFVISLITDILSTVAVPLFLMVTGTLLLSKEEDWKQIYQKRGLRIIKVIVLFTTIRYLYECIYAKTHSFSFLELIEVILEGNLFVPYWFLYTYLSILFVLPFLKKIMHNLNEKEMHILVLLIFVFYVLRPVISALLGLKLGVSFMWDISCCYCILGYYLEHVVATSVYTKKNMMFTILIIVGSIVFSYWLAVRERKVTGLITGEYNAILSMLIAFCIFFVVKVIWGDITKRKVHRLAEKCIIIGGNSSFGIYLIEDYLRESLSFIWDEMTPYVTMLPACAIWLMAVLVVGVIIVSLLKKIPGIKEIL